MPWQRRDPDPLEAQRRQLAEREKMLARQMSQLTQELRQAGEPVPTTKPEPPVWRLEKEEVQAPLLEPSRRPSLAMQRRRDRLIFFIFVGVLIVVAAICLWIYHTHEATGGGI